MSTKTKLPKWFKGELYNEGDVVKNPFSGEECKLNNDFNDVIYSLTNQNIDSLEKQILQFVKNKYYLLKIVNFSNMIFTLMPLLLIIGFIIKRAQTKKPPRSLEPTKWFSMLIESKTIKIIILSINQPAINKKIEYKSNVIKNNQNL